MTHRTATIFSLIVLVIVSACASSSKESRTPRASAILSDISGQDGRACIKTGNIDGYAVQDDNIITIRSNRKMYVATTLYQCHFLDTSPHAAFSSRFSQLCGGGRGRIYTANGDCPLHMIFEFDNKKAAFSALQQVEDLQKQAIDKRKAAKKAASKGRY